MTVVICGVERQVDMERGFEIWVGGRLKLVSLCSYEEAWAQTRQLGGTLKYRLLPLKK